MKLRSESLIALRVEWLRARARALRFTEETLLLKEEQRRILASFEARALEWEDRGTEVEHIVHSVQESWTKMRESTRLPSEYQTSPQRICPFLTFHTYGSRRVLGLH